MMDPRVTTLAHNLVNYSCRLKPGEKVLIENTGVQTDLVTELIREAYAAGARPYVHLRENAVMRALMMGASTEQLDLWAKYDAGLMADMNAYIGIRAGDNASELSDVPGEQREIYAKHYAHPVHSLIRVPKTKWVVLRYPSPSMAQSAGMSTEAFENFYFKVCCLDYSKMAAAMDKLVKRMASVDRVRLTGVGTDLSFSIKGIPAIPCAGLVNIPDGEVFTAPVKTSVNGVITFNTPTLNAGITHENVCLVFRDGKIIEATSSNTDALNKALDTDEGARYVGEFAIGVNPYILQPMKDTLFDEKIAGSFHFTPGRCYNEASNGNDSAIHWDMVFIQRPDFGGGEMWFDDQLVRKDGRFVADELLDLNPERLEG